MLISVLVIRRDISLQDAAGEALLALIDRSESYSGTDKVELAMEY